MAATKNDQFCDPPSQPPNPRRNLKGAIKIYDFLDCLKLADITPLHKKGRKSNKENYRPVSTLPTLSKILERIHQIHNADFEKDIVHNNVF